MVVVAVDDHWLLRVELAGRHGVERLQRDVDRAGETLAKVGEWLTAGTRLVWVVDPVRRVARVYRRDGSETLVAEDGALDGEDVVAGFACALREILSVA